MPATIQFVDSISATATVRLDINDAASWFCQDFSAPPPRLRRSESANSMRDGGIVSSSNYENRTLTLQLTLVNASTEDAAATEMQKLWRELDRSSNYLKYQREGMTKPVFFRLFRSDAAELEELWTTPIARNITLELLAEPHALGLKETGSVTINNDPAAASNGLFADITGVRGDVSTPMVAWWSAVTTFCKLAVVPTASTPPALLWAQAESLILATDTTNPGGGPDAAMSGTGTNNYVTTSFATATMQQRLRWSVPRNGTFRVLAIVRRSDATSTIFARTQLVGPNGATAYGPTVAVAFATNRRILDLGVVTIDSTSALGQVGYGSVNATAAKDMGIQAERTTGTGTLSWDAIILLPAGDVADARGPVAFSDLSFGVEPVLIDGVREQVSVWSGAGDPTAGTSTLGAVTPKEASLAGGFPSLVPNATNRVFAVHSGNLGASVKTTVLIVNYAYWPRYLYVRPVTT